MVVDTGMIFDLQCFGRSFLYSRCFLSVKTLDEDLLLKSFLIYKLEVCSIIQSYSGLLRFSMLCGPSWYSLRLIDGLVILAGDRF